MRWLFDPMITAVQAPLREQEARLQQQVARFVEEHALLREQIEQSIAQNAYLQRQVAEFSEPGKQSQEQLMHECARAAALDGELRIACRMLALAYDNNSPKILDCVKLRASVAAFQPGQGRLPETASIFTHLPPLQRQRCLREWHALTVQLGEQTPDWVYRAMTLLMDEDHSFGEQPEEVNRCWGDAHKHTVLAHLHERLQPEQYLEIGVDTGASLRLARCPAIGVDPAPRIQPVDLSDDIQLVLLTSDRYFERLRSDTELPPAPDLVFIDGMHLFESVLRDLANVERIARPSTLVVIDDIYPCHPTQALRQRESGAWTGDVWKIVELLQTYRSDLTLVPLNSHTTGLLLVAGLNPGNRTFLEKVRALPIDPERTPPETVLRREGALPSDHPVVDQLLDVLRTARVAGAGVAEVREQLDSLIASLANQERV